VFTPVVWKIKVPPRIYIFLWLLDNNKTFTRTTWRKGEWWKIALVYFVLNKSQFHISFFSVALPGPFGVGLVRLGVLNWGQTLSLWAGFGS
jgi:hypothetical protein